MVWPFVACSVGCFLDGLCSSFHWRDVIVVLGL
jgi:hypothetical protein